MSRIIYFILIVGSAIALAPIQGIEYTKEYFVFTVVLSAIITELIYRAKIN